MDTFKETEDYFQFIRPYQEAMDFLMVQIKILNEDYRYRDYPIHNIQSRIKEKESIVEKLRRKELPQNFEESDVYHVAEQKKKYSDMICIRESDYIKNPKPNGYKNIWDQLQNCEDILYELKSENDKEAEEQ